jgi:hypothetical protein
MGKNSTVKTAISGAACKFFIHAQVTSTLFSLTSCQFCSRRIKTLMVPPRARASWLSIGSGERNVITRAAFENFDVRRSATGFCRIFVERENRSDAAKAAHLQRQEIQQSPAPATKVAKQSRIDFSCKRFHQVIWFQAQGQPRYSSVNRPLKKTQVKEQEKDRKKTLADERQIKRKRRPALRMIGH